MAASDIDVFASRKVQSHVVSSSKYRLLVESSSTSRLFWTTRRVAMVTCASMARPSIHPSVHYAQELFSLSSRHPWNRLAPAQRNPRSSPRVGGTPRLAPRPPGRDDPAAPVLDALDQVITDSPAAGGRVIPLPSGADLSQLAEVGELLFLSVSSHSLHIELLSLVRDTSRWNLTLTHQNIEPTLGGLSISFSASSSHSPGCAYTSSLKPAHTQLTRSQPPS